jgi:predicted transcriptional regulator
MGGSHTNLPADLFMELASETRCTILLMLREEPTRTNKLAKDLSLTVQETHRNTSRLTEAGIIRKDSEGLFFLTEYGKLIVEQIKYYQFLYRYQKFFEDHTCDLPPKFKQRLGDLHNCELITKVTNVQQRIKKMESEAKERIQLIVSQAWEDEGKTLLDRVKNGVKISTIFGFESVMPDEIVDNIQKKLTSFIQKGALEQKIVDGNVKVSLFIADRQTAVMFPNQKGEVDMNTLFVGKDSEFYEWCYDYFEYMWNIAKPIIKGRTKFY